MRPVIAGNVSMPHVDGVSHSFVDVDGLSIHVAEAGVGSPVVLLHGWPQNWYCWRKVIPLLADRYRLIMPDLRGHGWSEAPPNGYDKEQLATDLIGLMDALDLDDALLVGHDWGGWVGFLACLREPHRFSSFLALGILHPFQQPSFAKLTQSWRGAYQLALSTPVVAASMLQLSPRFVQAAIRVGCADQDAVAADDRLMYGRIFQQPDRARATVQLYRTFLVHEVPRLRRYSNEHLLVPTALLIGEEDPIYAEPFMVGWQDHAEQMSVEVMTGLGHFLPEEAPLEVARQVAQLDASR